MLSKSISTWIIITQKKKRDRELCTLKQNLWVFFFNDDLALSHILDCVMLWIMMDPAFDQKKKKKNGVFLFYVCSNKCLLLSSFKRLRSSLSTVKAAKLCSVNPFFCLVYILFPKWKTTSIYQQIKGTVKVSCSYLFFLWFLSLFFFIFSLFLSLSFSFLPCGSMSLLFVFLFLLFPGSSKGAASVSEPETTNNKE